MLMLCDVNVIVCRYDPDNKESLLNPGSRTAGRARQTLNNLRKSCNVAGNCRLQVLQTDLDETMALLTHRHLSMLRQEQGQQGGGEQPAHRGEQQQDLPPLAELLAESPAAWQERAAHIRASLEFGGSCELCLAAVRVLFVTPCACLLCVDCASLERTRCARCETPYLMQVCIGLIRGRPLACFACPAPMACLFTHPNDNKPHPTCFAALCGPQAVDDPSRLADNPNPKWEVPLELIEWQPAYAQQGASPAAYCVSGSWGCLAG